MKTPIPIEPVGKLVNCVACTCRPEATAPLGGRGMVTATLAIVAQNPSDGEDVAHRAFGGGMWRELQTWLTILGVPEDAYWLTYAVKCHTAENRPPSAKEIKTCADMWLTREVAMLPNLIAIITLGDSAKKAVVGAKKKGVPSVKLTEASRLDITEGGRVLAVFPLPSPSYFLRTPEDKPYHVQVVLPEIRKALVEVGVL